MILNVDSPFDFGQTVYLITDKDQRPRMLLAVLISIGGVMRFMLGCGEVETWHYGIEISAEPNPVLTSTN